MANKFKTAQEQCLNLLQNLSSIFPKHVWVRSCLDHETEYVYNKDQLNLTRFGLKLLLSPGFFEFSSNFPYTSTVTFLPVQFTSVFSPSHASLSMKKDPGPYHFVSSHFLVQGGEKRITEFNTDFQSEQSRYKLN